MASSVKTSKPQFPRALDGSLASQPNLVAKLTASILYDNGTLHQSDLQLSSKTLIFKFSVITYSHPGRLNSPASPMENAHGTLTHLRCG